MGEAGRVRITGIHSCMGWVGGRGRESILGTRAKAVDASRGLVIPIHIRRGAHFPCYIWLGLAPKMVLFWIFHARPKTECIKK